MGEAQPVAECLNSADDALFILAARNALPDHIAEIRRLRAEVKNMEADLANMASDEAVACNRADKAERECRVLEDCAHLLWACARAWRDGEAAPGHLANVSLRNFEVLNIDARLDAARL